MQPIFLTLRCSSMTTGYGSTARSLRTCYALRGATATGRYTRACQDLRKNLLLSHGILCNTIKPTAKEHLRQLHDIAQPRRLVYSTSCLTTLHPTDPNPLKIKANQCLNYKKPNTLAWHRFRIMQAACATGLRGKRTRVYVRAGRRLRHCLRARTRADP